MNPRAILLTALALLLFTPSVQAANLGNLESGSVATDNASAAGDLRALLLDESAFQNLSSLIIRGHISGRLDTSNTPFVVAGASADDGTTTRQPIEAQAATIGLQSSNLGARIIIFSTDANTRAHLDESNLQFEPQLDNLRYNPRITGNPEIHLQTATTLFGGGATGHLVLNGSFQVILYGANFTVETSDGQASYMTGYESRPYAPSVIRGVPFVENVTQREAYLSVHGELTLDLSPTWSIGIANPLIETAEGEFSILEARGQLSVDGVQRPINQQTVRVAGQASYKPIVTELATLTGPLEGKLSSLRIDGTNVPLEDNEPQYRWIWLLFIPALLVALYLSYRATCSRGLLSLERKMNAGDYRGAIHLATKLMMLPRTSEDAVVVQTVAWLKLEQLDKAKAAVNRRPRGPDRVRPGRLYLRARIAGLEGKEEQAKQNLLECLLLAPHYLIEALSDPILAPLVKDVQAALPEGYA